MERETKTLLVVDGSASSLFSLVMLLRRLEYRVVTARSGREALLSLEKALPAAIVADSCLPDMDGAALLETVKENERFHDIPVVLLLSRENAALQAACSRPGCASLPKTCEPAELYRVVQALSESVPRQNIRLAASLRVFVGDGTALGGAERTETATAISEGGLYVKTRYPQPRNAVVPLRLVLGEHEVRARAVVLYSSADGMGLKFSELANGDRENLRRFIKERLTKDIAQ